MLQDRHCDSVLANPVAALLTTISRTAHEQLECVWGLGKTVLTTVTMVACTVHVALGARMGGAFADQSSPV
jgi:hypothetical protein